MPRHNRAIVPETPIHIIQRGNNRAKIFLDPGDFAVCKSYLQRASVQNCCVIHAYVLMSNHLHLLVTPSDTTGPARMMQSLGIRYVRYFNHRYERTGTLWEGRFRSSPIQSSRYYFTCSRYIELNPVRANIVDHPSHYVWSSFHRNASGAPDALITPHSLYRALGARRDEQLSAYQALFAHAIDSETLSEIGTAAHIGTPLGAPTYRHEMEALLQRRLDRMRNGGDRRSRKFQKARAAWVSASSDPLKP